MTIKHALLSIFIVSQCFFANSIMSADDQKNDQGDSVIVERNEALINAFEEYGKVIDKELAEENKAAAERKKAVDEFFKPLTEYRNRPQDGLDHFVNKAIDVNFAIKNMSLLLLVVAGFVFSNNKVDDTLHSAVGLKFAASLFVKFLAYGILYNWFYNASRFLLERTVPVSYVNALNERLLNAQNRFPRIGKYLGAFVGLCDAFITHYL